METVVKSTVSGKVKKIHVQTSQQVQGDDLLVELEKWTLSLIIYMIWFLFYWINLIYSVSILLIHTPGDFNPPSLSIGHCHSLLCSPWPLSRHLVLDLLISIDLRFDSIVAPTSDVLRNKTTSHFSIYRTNFVRCIFVFLLEALRQNANIFDSEDRQRGDKPLQSAQINA